MGVILQDECNITYSCASSTTDPNWWHFNVDAYRKELVSALDRLYAGPQEESHEETTSIQLSCA